MFEAAFEGIPVILYATDIDKYNKDRKFYFDIRSLPFPLAECNTELMTIIENWNQTQYLNQVNDFKTHLGVVNTGTASTEVADVIVKKMAK